MKRGPDTMPAIDHLARARAAWGPDIPDAVVILAEEAGRSSLKAAAARIGYSPSVVSEVIGGRYRGDFGRVCAAIAGALMGVAVDCPVLGKIGRDRCLDEQRRPWAATSSLRARLARACRAGCPHARQPGGSSC